MTRNYIALPRGNLATYAIVLLIGIYVRLDQFLSQVLIDDEWHAIHQLLRHTPRELFLSFGYSDYSIPLTLIYWLQAQWFGLSELGMRAPMMAFGLATLILFPLYVRRTFGTRVALLFGFLLAVSPLLFSYSRIARPYAITLFLGFAAHVMFYCYLQGGRNKGFCAIGYATAAILVTWMHPIAGPFVVAPFVIEGWRSLLAARTDRGHGLIRLLYLGVPTALGMMILILPPLLSDPEAMGGKAGIDSPSWQTLRGVWYLWFGTPLTAAAIIGLALAGFGARRLWHDLPIARSAVTGLLLTLALILFTRPAWVHFPLTFGRYLLPMVPLLLLAVALGAARLSDAAARRIDMSNSILPAILSALLLLPLLARSPLADFLHRPNTNTLHSIHLFDYRPKHNPALKRVATIPLSPYWTTLAQQTPESLRIAAAPWHFMSYDWDAPRWERIGHQPIIPGYLTGLCVDQRYGEVPNDSRFRFRNAVHLGDARQMASKGIDQVVFQKPYSQITEGKPQIIGEDTAHCESALRDRFGKPIYEDAMIIVFSARSLADSPGNAQR